MKKYRQVDKLLSNLSAAQKKYTEFLRALEEARSSFDSWNTSGDFESLTDMNKLSFDEVEGALGYAFDSVAEQIAYQKGQMESTTQKKSSLVEAARELITKKS